MALVFNLQKGLDNQQNNYFDCPDNYREYGISCLLKYLP